MADVRKVQRPLSPHLQVYRPQLTSISSILVRITGIALLGLSALVVAWFLAAATSETAFAAMDGFLRGWFGSLIMLGGVWAFVYHMLGRLRHLLWDFGYCVDVPTSEKLAIGMLGLSTLVTLIVALV